MVTFSREGGDGGAPASTKEARQDSGRGRSTLAMKHLEEQQEVFLKRRFTQPEAGCITLPSVIELLPRKCWWKSKQKDNLVMNKCKSDPPCVGSLPGRWFSVDKDIRLPVLPFVHLLFISLIVSCSHSSMVISCLVEVILSCIWSLFSLLFPDIFSLLLLFISMKVLCYWVT